MMADVVEMETEDSTSAIFLARGVVGAHRQGQVSYSQVLEGRVRRAMWGLGGLQLDRGPCEGGRAPARGHVEGGGLYLYGHV